uniref:DUF1263 domain-containing protein n=1 Tax=Oryza sativa subsp. japonica TaxID=39947 RepID=Q69L48_ORYSJ|nr:hypothetical protein [Oryza sativa Japonica Group]BAD36471.1 hypothetical protein [Oryza sativa Japonica Group]
MGRGVRQTACRHLTHDLIGANTPAPARDECLEALILTGWGEACVRPPVAT